MTERRRIDPQDVPVMRVRSDRVVWLGIWAWLVALVATLLVPALHGPGREWWPWTCLVGLAVGVVGHLYVRTGRAHDRGA